MLVDALAGAISGCISRVVVGPLDVIKIRFQVQIEPVVSSPAATSKYTGFRQALVTILKEEGITGLWRGTVPGLLLTVPYTAVQFVALHQCKEAAARYGLTGPDRPTSSSIVSFGSGALAGAAGTVASYPFDLLRTTLAAQGEPKVYHNIVDATRGIVKEGGVRSLYRGLGVTLVEIVPYAALQFGLYDMFTSAWKASQADRRTRQAGEAQLRQRLGQPGSSSSSSPPPLMSSVTEDRLANFLCGLMAGVASKLASHPLDVAKKRYQVAGLQRSLSYGARVEGWFALNSLRQGLVDIYKAEGMAGLWKGSFPSIIKAAPAAAVTFTAYDIILGMLLKASAATAAAEAAAK